MPTETKTGRSLIRTTLTIGIASVWLINGFFCKLLNVVPRHEMIVARILGDTYSILATKTIGVLEIFMAIWVISGIRARWCALFQIFIVATMNIIEFILAPDLLLFGHINAVVAPFFMGLVFVNEFFIQKGKNS